MVILNRLEAHNFRKLNITLDFPQGMLIIKGPNEAGKSTILEAILYALFGKLMRGTKELAINHQSNIAKIKLTFTVNGQQYLVQRILKRTETRAKIYKITSNGLVPQALTVQETNKFIKNLLGGLSFNEILVTNIVAQKELNKLLELKGQSREKIINALLGLESYNKAIEKIAEERREKGRELEAKKDKLSEIEKRLQAYKKDLKELKEKQQKLKDNEQELNEKNKELKEKYPIYLKLREYREALNQKCQLEAELKGVENVVKQLKQNLENLEKQIGEKRETLNKTIEEVLEENDRLVKEKQKLEKYKNLEKTKELLKEAEKRFKELQELENNKQTLLNGLKKVKEELKRLKEKQESKETKEILKREEELQQKLKKTKISPIMFFLLLLPSILALISFPLIAIGPLVVTAYIFYITKIRSSLQQELIKIKDKVIELKGLPALIQQNEKQVRELEQSITIMENQEENLENEVKTALLSLEEKYKPKTWINLKDLFEKTKENLLRLEKEKTEIETRIVILASKIQSLKSQIKELEKDVGYLMERREETIKSIEEKERERLEIQRKIDSIKLPKLPDGIQYSEELYQKVEQEITELSKKISTLKGTIEELRRNVEELSRRVEENKSVEQEYEQAKREIKELETLIEAQTLAIEKLRETAKHVREKFLPAIEINMSQIISQITGGIYKAVRLNEDYNIEVLDSNAGKFISKDIYSGGTVDQFLLAMRLAFILSLLPQTKQTYPQFLFLDEPLASSDQNRRTNIINLLTKTLSKEFKQIILITHLDINPQNTRTITINQGKITSNS